MQWYAITAIVLDCLWILKIEDLAFLSLYKTTGSNISLFLYIIYTLEFDKSFIFIYNVIAINRKI